MPRFEPTIFKEFFAALSLLSAVPVPQKFLAQGNPNKHRQREIIYYPLVGFVLALLISALTSLIEYALPTSVVAMITLILWVAMTGALHLDGLGDCIDAAFAHHDSPARTLEVMKDPRIGAMGTVSIVLLLLLKFVMIEALLESSLPLIVALMVALGLARLNAAIYMSTTKYISANGMLTGLEFSGQRKNLAFLSLLLAICSAVVLGVLPTFVLVSIAVALVFFWRSFWLRRIGGYNGDCIGALIEISEILSLLAFIAIYTLLDS